MATRQKFPSLRQLPTRLTRTRTVEVVEPDLPQGASLDAGRRDWQIWVLLRLDDQSSDDWSSLHTDQLHHRAPTVGEVQAPQPTSRTAESSSSTSKGFQLPAGHLLS